MTTIIPVDALEKDVLASILSYLTWKEILNARVCKKWKEAAKLTLVPESVTVESYKIERKEIYVKNYSIAKALTTWIVDALPRIQSINFDFNCHAKERFDFAEGEDPVLDDPDPGMHPGPFPPVNIRQLANFHDLRQLYLMNMNLNGSYPFLFNFANLQTLNVSYNRRFKWNLDMLRGLRKLKILRAWSNGNLTGNLHSVRVLCSSLVELSLRHSSKVEGQLNDIADFPLLEKLDVSYTQVTGDIRKIAPNDFISLKELKVGDKVYGGGNIEKISDAQSVMLARYYLKKHHPNLFESRCDILSIQSPDRYQIHGHRSRSPPFDVEFVKAGSRLGWRWTNAFSGGSCETQWLDPEPKSTDQGYDTYIKDLENLDKDVSFYRGFSRPPTQQEHQQKSAEIPLDPRVAAYSSRRSFGVW